MDLVAIWKAASIVLTGAFGMLGLLTEFRDKTSGKVTTWGYLSLFGIVISSGGGFFAQIEDSFDQATQQSKASMDSLKLLMGMHTTLHDLQRTLSPIGKPRFDISLQLDCNNERYSRSCSSMIADLQNHRDPWKDWPIEAPACCRPADVILKLEIFADKNAAHHLLEGKPTAVQSADLSYEIELFAASPHFLVLPTMIRLLHRTID